MGMLQWLTTTDWFPFGPSPIDAPGVGLGLADGRIEAAAPDPANADTLYAAANDGGVWKTGVWGNDPPVWLPMTDDQLSLNFAGYHPIKVHPEKTALVFGAVCGPGAGGLKSANHFGESLENRFGPLGPTRVQIPPLRSLSRIPLPDWDRRPVRSLTPDDGSR